MFPSLPTVHVAVATRFQIATMLREAELQTPLDSEPEVPPFEAESDPVDKSVDVGLASLFQSSVAAESIHSELVDSTQLIRLQQSDPGLAPLFKQAEKGDERYLVRSGVLLRTWRDKLAPPDRSIRQIVAPASLLHNRHEPKTGGCAPFRRNCDPI